MPSYAVGNSSPLRTYSPKRGDAGQQQSAQTHQQQMSSTAGGNTFNVTQVNKAQTTTTVSHSHSYGTGGNCAGAPTEKERMIQ